MQGSEQSIPRLFQNCFGLLPFRRDIFRKVSDGLITLSTGSLREQTPL